MSNEKIPKITIISGDNQFELRNAKSKFVERAEKLFPNHIAEYFDGTGEITFGEFISKIQTPSMFGDARFLFINHAENKNNLAGKSNFEAFENVMNLCVDNIFIFIEIDETDNEKLSKNAFSAKELATKMRELTKKFDGDFFEFKAMKEYEIPEWIVGKVQEYFRRTITKQNAELLVKFSGADLGVLDGELRKMDAALPPKKEITQDDICELTGNNKQISSSEIVNFIALRKWDNYAITAFDSFSGRDNSFAIPFLSELYRKFAVLLKIRLYIADTNENKVKAIEYLNKKNDYNARNRTNTLAFEIGVGCGLIKPTQDVKAAFPIIIKPQLIEQASLYKKEEIFEAINIIAQYDREMKNGIIKSEDNFRTTIKELCRKIVRLGK